MNRCFFIVLFLPAVGCQLPPERGAVRPLQEDAAPMAFTDLIGRARLQATAATEAFYVNRWSDLEEVAHGLEQTARFMNKATDVPPSLKNGLEVKAAALQQDATKLREAARAQNVSAVNETMQQINLKVRELRPEK
jgi:hypothetical protein